MWPAPIKPLTTPVRRKWLSRLIWGCCLQVDDKKKSPLPLKIPLTPMGLSKMLSHPEYGTHDGVCQGTLTIETGSL